jgi:hypothetical protein
VLDIKEGKAVTSSLHVVDGCPHKARAGTAESIVVRVQAVDADDQVQGSSCRVIRRAWIFFFGVAGGSPRLGVSFSHPYRTVSGALRYGRGNPRRPRDLAIRVSV